MFEILLVHRFLGRALISGFSAENELNHENYYYYKMKAIKFLLFLIGSFCLLAATSVLSSGYLDFFSFSLRGIVSLLLYFFIPIFLKNKGSFDIPNAIAVLISPFVIFATSILPSSDMALAYKLTSWMPIAGYGLAFLFEKSNLFQKKVLVISSSLILSLLLIKVFPAIIHNHIFSTYDSSVNLWIDDDYIIGVKESGDTLLAGDLKSEFTVLHFWSTACGACKIEMESYNKLLESEIKDKVQICPIKIDLPRDKADDYLYNFNTQNNTILPTHITKSQAEQAFQINSLPTSMVLHNQIQIISLGTLEEAIDAILEFEK